MVEELRKRFITTSNALYRLKEEHLDDTTVTTTNLPEKHHS